MFELLGVAYTVNPPLVLSLCRDQHRAKPMFEAAGLPRSPYFLVERQSVPGDHGLAVPVIVKPALEARGRHVLAEYAMSCRGVRGWREIHAGVLGNDRPEVLPLFEMEQSRGGMAAADHFVWRQVGSEQPDIASSVVAIPRASTCAWTRTGQCTSARSIQP